jgi:hypothetical protein
MILSHRHRFIYIRCRKTASTSMELALSRICGPDDVVTRLPWPEDEALRRQIGGRGPQNHLGPHGRMRFYNHMPAAEIRLLVGEDVWNGYYKWCVERNPWDKVVSDYYYRFRHPSRPTLREFLEAAGGGPAARGRVPRPARRRDDAAQGQGRVPPGPAALLGHLHARGAGARRADLLG